MTGIFLLNELQSLIQESKRKSPETRTAAERSLADLKSLSITSESQLSGDLVRKPQFVDPFVFACRNRNAKLAIIAVSCLQRLAAGKAIPRERLSDVLDALREIAALSLEVQLKILQTLPSLLQRYSSDIRGPLLAVALEICDTLQASKTGVVSSTAEATFQQLVTTVYDRVSVEDGQPSEKDSHPVQTGNGTTAVGPAAYDAFRIFADLCALANATQPTFVQLKTLSPHFLLEVIGSIVTNYSGVLACHPEQLQVCRSSLLPALNSVMATKTTFAVLVRVLRTIYVLLRQHLQDMVIELEDGLLSMISLLDPSTSQPWRRVLSMEVFRGLCIDTSLFRDLYRLYDDAEDRKNVVGDLLAAFVRIASEDPTLIGLGLQSTMPSQHGDAANGDGFASFESSDIGGAVGGVVSASATVTGLSTEWSTVKVPYLEQLDKSNLSDIPTTYIYNLVLNCISAIAEGISRFVMPLSVPSKAYTQRTKTTKLGADTAINEGSSPAPMRSSTSIQNQDRLINPLTLSGHPQIQHLSSCARMLDGCWPPILATCSTFFNASLDAEYYHNLVRAFQKLTQVSGVLELATARDAFLTTLSKAAVPSSTNTRLFSPSIRQNGFSEDAAVTDATAIQTPQLSVSREFGRPRLSIRNLLCLRALLNLGIALGPSLGTDAWFIILETLERGESLILLTRTLNSSDGVHTEERPAEQGDTRTLFDTETAAVQTATKRMLESTSSYTDEAFTLFVKSLLKLDPFQESAGISSTLLSPKSPTGTPSRARMHRTNRSISALWISPETAAEDQDFVISKIADLAQTNMHRFLSPDSSACSWQLLVRKLLDVFSSHENTIKNRLTSAEKIDAIVLGVVKALDHDESEINTNAAILKHCFSVLLAQLRTIQDETQSSETDLNLRHESHAKLLATLEIMIGDCGESLTHEWSHVLKLISSAFILDDDEDTHQAPEEDLQITQTMPRSEAILQRSFACLELLVSDFLGTLKSAHLTTLTVLLFFFGSQNMVLNISLTAVTTFFWNVSSLLLETLCSKANGADPDDEKPTIADARRIFTLLFSRMSLLSLDSRSDVRQSSIRMTRKVLEAANDQLSAAALNTYMLRLLALCRSQVTRHEDAEREAKASWQEATMEAFSCATDTVVHNIQKIRSANNFTETWATYLSVGATMLDQRTLPMSGTVYKGFAKMLQSLDVEKGEQKVQRAESVLEICLEYHPADIDPGRESNQAALTQYATTLAAVISAGCNLQPNSSKAVRAVERIVLECVHPPYTSDTKKLALEQEAVVDLLPRLQRLLPYTACAVLLRTFISAPIADVGPRTNATFISLASRCSDILRAAATANLPSGSDTADLVPILETLTRLVATKYSSLPQGGPIPLWRNATTSAVQIIQFSLRSEVDSMSLPQMTSAFTALATSILQAGGLPIAHGLDLTDDESFDISSFEALRETITPRIGHKTVPSDLLKSYILALFHASLVAEPIYFDLPDDLTNMPLEDFSTVRPGTVRDPIYAKRNRVCYTALEALFKLVGADADKRPESLRLATLAAPYLLLRCAYTFKTFIADQPLRSISALPQPLRVELLAILNKCIELRCDKETFTGVMKGENSDGKLHLRLLNGLLVQFEECWRRLPRKATGVNWQDRKDGKEIEQALARWRSSLAEGWEIIT